MNYKETNSKIDLLIEEAKKIRTISEFVDKLKKVKDLARNYNNWLLTQTETKEDRLQKVVDDEKLEIKRLVESTIKGYELTFNIRDRSFYRNDIYFKFEPLSPDSPEHDWEIKTEEDDYDDYYGNGCYDNFYGDGFYDRPFYDRPFGFPPPKHKSYMKMMKRRRRKDKRDLNKIFLTVDGKTSATFSSDEIMKDLQVFKTISDKIINITKENNDLLSEIRNNNQNNNDFNFSLENLFDPLFRQLQPEFKTGEILKLKTPLSFKDGKATKNSNTPKVIKSSNVNTKLFMDDTILISKKNNELTFYMLFDNDIKPEKVFKLNNELAINGSVEVLEVKNGDEIKSRYQNRIKTMKLGSFIMSIINDL